MMSKRAINQTLAPWDLNSFRDDHLPHRVAILKAFINHWRKFTERDKEIWFALKDAAMITCRAIWEILGVRTDNKEETDPANPGNVTILFQAAKVDLPSGVTVTSIKPLEFLQLPEAGDLLLVLVAANKCVAHLDEYPNNGVSEQVLGKAINSTLKEIKKRISPVPKGL